MGGTARQTAERRQRRIARQRRDALRELLRSAAQKGALPWGVVMLGDFTRDGKAPTTTFINLDEDLEAGTSDPAAAPSDVGSRDLEQLLAQRQQKQAEQAVMRERVREEMARAMDTGIRANAALTRMYGVDTSR